MDLFIRPREVFMVMETRHEVSDLGEVVEVTEVYEFDILTDEADIVS